MNRHFRLNLWSYALTILLAFSFASCEKEGEEPGGGGSKLEPNTVVGTVTDAQGNPLGGVKIRAENPLGNNMHVDGTTGNDGKYKLKLTGIGGWKIYAWKEVEYGGKVYHLRLGMKEANDYDAFATEDKTVTKDFVWKLKGRIPDRSASYENGWGYFGGSLRFVNLNNQAAGMATGTKITITLTPVSGAKYLDGTAATQPVINTFTIQQGNTNFYIGDIPVTEYRVTASSLFNGVTKQVYISANNLSNFSESIEFLFDPATNSSGTYENGLKSPSDFPLYMEQRN